MRWEGCGGGDVRVGMRGGDGSGKGGMRMGMEDGTGKGMRVVGSIVEEEWKEKEGWIYVVMIYCIDFAGKLPFVPIIPSCLS